MTCYFAIDGDDIGRQLENLVASNNIAGVKVFSNNVKTALNVLEKFLHENNCEIIFSAGDSILAFSQSKIKLSNIPLIQGEISFSMGVGKSGEQALLALKRAKVLGKRRYEVAKEMSFEE